MAYKSAPFGAETKIFLRRRCLSERRLPRKNNAGHPCQSLQKTIYLAKAAAKVNILHGNIVSKIVSVADPKCTPSGRKYSCRISCNPGLLGGASQKSIVDNLLSVVLQP